MTNLVAAYERNEIFEFEKILKVCHCLVSAHLQHGGNNFFIYLNILKFEYNFLKFCTV